MKIVILLVLFFVCNVCFAAKGDVRLLSTYRIANVSPYEVRKEGNKEITESKKVNPDLGCIIYSYLQNTSNKEITLEDIKLYGKSLKELSSGPEYNMVWHRLFPASIKPGEVGEVSFFLRQTMSKPEEVEYIFSNNVSYKSKVELNPAYRFMTITFSSDFKKAYIYFKAKSVIENFSIDSISINGERVSSRDLKSFSVVDNNGDLCDMLVVNKDFVRGDKYVFTTSSKFGNVGASIRAFNNFSVYGTYGDQDIDKYSKTGMNLLNSFHPWSKEQLDKAQSSGMVVGSHMPFDVKEIPSGIANHPALLGMTIGDEPDCADFAAGIDRPMNLRIGTMAPKVIDAYNTLTKLSPKTMVIETVDLTFTPWNYFVYAPLIDLANPDCYTVTAGWDVSNMRNMSEIMKVASAPRPFMYIHQSSYEEFTKSEYSNNWYGRGDLAKVKDEIRDNIKLRGLGRVITRSEVKNNMLYCTGNGSKGLSAYTDKSEAGFGLSIFGSEEFPEIYSELAKNCRMYRMVDRLIDISTDIKYVTSNKDRLWVKTLLCGNDAVLVTAVNEDSKTTHKDYILNPQKNVEYTFKNMSFIKPNVVARVEDGKFVVLKAKKTGDTFTWVDNEVVDGALYILVKDIDKLNELQNKYNTTAPIATEDGKKDIPEGMFNGKRNIW